VRGLIGGLLAFAACAPGSDVPVADRAAYLVAALAPDGTIEALYAFDADELRGSIPADGALTYRILEYDVSVGDLRLVRDEKGRVETFALSTAPPDSWALERPVAWSERGPGAATFEARPLADIDAWTAGFVVRRPPCAPEPVQRAIEGLERLHPRSEVTFMLRLGDHVFFGVGPQQPTGVFRVKAGEVGAVALLAFVDPGDSDRPGSRAYRDGDRIWVQWFDPTRPGYQLVAIDEGGLPVERFHPDGIDAGMSFGRIAGRGAAVLGHVSRRPPVESIGEIYRLTRTSTGGRWAQIGTATTAPGLRCEGHHEDLILDFEEPRAGWIGIQDGPIARFDLAAVDPIDRNTTLTAGVPRTDKLCRNARATLSNGTEVLAYERSRFDRESGLLWRAPGAADWSHVPGAGASSGDLVASNGEHLVVAGGQRAVAIYDFIARRPDLPPRLCHQLAVGIDVVRFGTPIDERTLMIGGLDGLRAQYLEFE